jgi:hypothetical protein
MPQPPGKVFGKSQAGGSGPQSWFESSSEEGKLYPCLQENHSGNFTDKNISVSLEGKLSSKIQHNME